MLFKISKYVRPYFYFFILVILCPYKVHFSLVLFKGTREGSSDTGRVLTGFNRFEQILTAFNSFQHTQFQGKLAEVIWKNYFFIFNVNS